MVVQHNLRAMNSNRMLGITANAQSKSTEKLSSGYKINRAADDAAGLSISEKMRSQIRGLNKASANAQDGISLIQTAEGALHESHSILQRMRELAVQAANGTETNDDREAVQNEIAELQDELTRISETTEFNTMKLLDGSLDSPKGVSTSANQTIGGQVATLKAAQRTVTAADAGTIAYGKDTITIDGANIEVDWTTLTKEEKSALEVDWTSSAPADDTKARKAAEIIQNKINEAIDASGLGVAHVSVKASDVNKFMITSGSKGVDSEIKVAQTTGGGVMGLIFDTDNAAIDTTTAATGTVVGSTNYAGEAIKANDKLYMEIAGQKLVLNMSAEVKGDGTATMASVASTLQTTINNAINAYNGTGNTERDSADKLEKVTVEVSKDGRLVVNSESGAVSFSDLGIGETAKKLGLDAAGSKTGANGGMTLQIGANEGQTMNFGIANMSAEALGVAGNKVDLSTQAGAEKATTTIDAAIKKVSEQRSKLGAVQNRLEHTIANLDTAAENTQNAESRIRDTDMAAEMVAFSNNNILAQAGQAMLAQANQANQGVLSLLG